MPAAPSPSSPVAGGQARWQVQLLGGLLLTDGQQQITRLPSRAVAALLARLALWPARTHAREELVELLWPGVALPVGRNRLRQALSTLRSLLGQPQQTPLLLADRLGVRVAAGALACDVHRFEALVHSGRLAEAAAVYRGELMPGFYDEWIADERLRLAALADRLPDTPVPMARLPPPPPPRDAGPGLATLPSYPTRFFGADGQARRLRALVATQRLVTVTGPGGSGKTRLAVEVAQSLCAPAPVGDAGHATAGPAPFDLVGFVPLSSCADAGALGDALLATLRMRRGRDDALDTVAAGLAGRRALLVLDNLEHLLPQAAASVSRLVLLLPQLHLLATSRRLLGVDGEHEHRVEPLALPSETATPAEVAASPAVALFVDRARAARADFHLGERNALTLGALVRALDGLPLALELAASRVRSLSPAEMLERLRARPSPGRTPALDLLSRSGPRGGFDTRHASMARVVQWSWEQLAADEAALLAALTVFEGGFTLQAAQAVAPPGDTALALDTLHAHSLLHAQEGPDQRLRFALYEPVREFAAARLSAAEQQALRARHRAWLLQWAGAFGPTPPLAQVRAELPNVEAALTGALADGEPDAALALVLALRTAFRDASPPAPLLAHAEAALAASADAPARSRVHTLLGVLSFEVGRRDAALRHIEQGLALAPPGSLLQARALHALASVRWRMSRDAAPLRPLIEQAQALAEAAGDRETLASVFALNAFIANVAERDHARGEALHRQALALWEASGNEHAINAGLYNLAICAFNARRWGEALLRLEAVCANAREHDDRQQLSAALNVLGNTLSSLREWPRALQAYRECVDVAWHAAEPLALSYGLWNAPRALAHQRQPLAAARLMGFAAQYWVAHFGPLAAGDRLDLRRVRRLAAVQAGGSAADAALAEGGRLSLGDAVALLRDAAA